MTPLSHITFVFGRFSQPGGQCFPLITWVSLLLLPRNQITPAPSEDQIKPWTGRDRGLDVLFWPGRHPGHRVRQTGRALSSRCRVLLCRTYYGSLIWQCGLFTSLTRLLFVNRLEAGTKSAHHWPTCEDMRSRVGAFSHPWSVRMYLRG